ncbi:MAG: YkgJ family cysteine cluster protein [Candidatus Anammoxibacter sp.]
MNSSLQSELEHIYNELDNEISLLKIECKECGTCCDFGKFDHVLFANILEIEYIIDNLERPLTTLVNGVCPFQDGNKCSVRKYRTLGCRVFYCDGAYKKDIASDIYNKYYTKIKKLTLKYGIDWEYKPFFEHLERYLVSHY